MEAHVNGVGGPNLLIELLSRKAVSLGILSTLPAEKMPAQCVGGRRQGGLGLP
jgi:hypothetical protein